jgi:hypothetical protein
MKISKNKGRSPSDEILFLSFDADYMADLDSHFTSVNLTGIHALSLTTLYKIMSPERTEIFHWIEAAPDLAQLSLVTDPIGRDSASIESLPSLGSFEYQIARGCKKLKNLRIQNDAWRILRNLGNNSQDEICFERLDRFETGAIEAFQPGYLFDENW